MADSKRKWYTVRARILDYSPAHLWVVSAVGAIILLTFLLLLFLNPQLRRPELSAVVAPIGGLWMAATGAAFYKSRKGVVTESPNAVQPGRRTSSLFQFVASAGFLVALFVFWLYLESRGYTTARIANGFAIVAAVILVCCVAVVFFYSARNRGRR